MPLYEIRKSELPFYGERQRRGELLIPGMTVTPNGYNLQIVETPRVADALAHPPLPPVQPVKVPQIKRSEQETTNFERVAELVSDAVGHCDSKPEDVGSNPAALTNQPSPEPRTSPSATVGRTTVEPVAAPMMVTCFDCNTAHPANEDCPICVPLARAAQLARELRLAYHKWKRGEGPRPA